MRIHHLLPIHLGLKIVHLVFVHRDIQRFAVDIKHVGVVQLELHHLSLRRGRRYDRGIHRCCLLLRRWSLRRRLAFRIRATLLHASPSVCILLHSSPSNSSSHFLSFICALLPISPSSIPRQTRLSLYPSDSRSPGRFTQPSGSSRCSRCIRFIGSIWSI